MAPQPMNPKRRRAPTGPDASGRLNIVQKCPSVPPVAVFIERRGPTATWGDAEARRRDILDAAAKILDREGYEALTMRAIAEGAAVSPGTIYHHFVDKQHVVAALMEQRLAALRAALVTASPTD